MTDDNKTPEKNADDLGTESSVPEETTASSPEPEFPPMPDDFMADKPAEPESKPFLSDDDKIDRAKIMNDHSICGRE